MAGALAALPLAQSVPVGLAILAYLNGRYRITNDLSALKTFFGGHIRAAIRERRDGVSIFYVLEEFATKTPNKIFLLYGGKTWTYRDAYENAIKYGTWLKTRHGVQKNEVVAMNFMNSDTFIWLWFGLWAIGAKPAFINYNLTGTPLLHSVRASGARLLLVDPAVWSTIDADTQGGLQKSGFKDDGGSLEVINFTADVFTEIDATIGKREPNSARSGQQLKDMAMLIYTSGTTGLPKPAVVSWGKASTSPALATQALEITKDDVFYTCMPLYHSSASILGALVILHGGAALALGRKFHRSGFWDEVRATDASIIHYVGETCRYLMSLPPSPKDKKHRVRLAFGNGLRPDVWPVFQKRFNIPSIGEFYAATEGSGSLFNYSKNEFSIGAVGVNGLITSKLLTASAIAEMDLETSELVRDPKTGLCRRVPDNVPGELLFKLDAANIEKNFQGYYRNDKATNSKILRDVFAKGDAYFSTGDLLRRDAEGRWFFSDRLGDTFRWKAENVSTAEVGEVFGKRGDLLEEANVYGVLVPGYDGRAGCVAVVLSPEQQSKFAAKGAIDPETLKALATEGLKNLPRFAVPVFLRLLKDENASHRTGTNKQQKHGLREEGVDPAKVEAKGDQMYWLPPGSKTYERFTEKEWKTVQAGTVKL